MRVFLNGQFVPEDQALVSIFDRSFLYGDGLFETIRVHAGKPFRWQQHVERLQRGAEFLRLRLPYGPAEILAFADQLIELNRMPESVLRLQLSRGVGPRGYSPQGAERPALVMNLQPAPVIDPNHPPRWRLITAAWRLLVAEPLAQFKTCNKLPQILARAMADAGGADEALLLNTNGEVAEAASGNLFWIDGETVCTPPVSSGVLPGVTRAVVLEICGQLKLDVQEAGIPPDRLRQMEGVFLSLSSRGVVEVGSLDGQPLSQSPLVGRLRAAYAEMLAAEAPSANGYM